MLFRISGAVYAFAMRRLIMLSVFAAVLAMSGTAANAHERHQHNQHHADNVPVAAFASFDEHAGMKEVVVTAALEQTRTDACLICGGTCCACGAACTGAAIFGGADFSFPQMATAAFSQGIFASEPPWLTADLTDPPKSFA